MEAVTVEKKRYDGLVKRFADVGIRLQIQTDPLVGSASNVGTRIRTGGSNARNDLIFQMDIQIEKGSKRKEFFRIYPGHPDNAIQVMGSDSEWGQVVLMVKEPRRQFEMPLLPQFVKLQMERHGVNWLAEVAREHSVTVRDIRVVKLGRSPEVLVRRWTVASSRYFLLGMDERQMFVAQLTQPCTSVQEAHKLLKNPMVTVAEGRVGRAERQGEWFFVAATPTEIDQIEKGVKSNKLILHRKVALGAVMNDGTLGRQQGGNPHTADELVVLMTAPPGLRSRAIAPSPAREREFFVRGAVKHIDHASMKFANWRRVFRNREGSAGSSGIGWID